MKYFTAVFIAGLLFFATPHTDAFGRDDWQLWNGYNLKVKLAEQFRLNVNGEQRFRDDFSESTLGNVNTGFSWLPSKYFEIGSFFKYEREKQSGGFHGNERRWGLDGTLKFDLGPFKLSNRNRIAYRDRNTTDLWRYRNSLKLSWPIPVKKITLTPFVSEEIFWETNSGAYNQNRIQMGVNAKLTRHFSLGLYYMIKSNRKDSDWDEVNVLGTSVTLSV